MKNSKLEDLIEMYGEPCHVGSKHLVWKDTEQNRAIKATQPGYLRDGTIIVVSQPWFEPADPSSPYPSTSEIASFMRGRGFSQINLTDWQHVDGTFATNLKPGDFIKTKDGVVPIDIDLVRSAKRNFS